MATNWTKDQLAAIETRQKTLLVSAAAGSGKTAVLTERAVQHMLDSKDPIDADRLLIVTFTRAAAQEMKQRISKKLSERIAAEPENAAARRQRSLLDRAMIGTIDSLCLNLLKENNRQAGLPAAFRVGDAQELEAMRQEAVNDVLENAYREQNEGFIALFGLLSGKRGDQNLAATVLKVLEFAMAHPFYREWMEEKLKVYSEFDTPQNSVWGRILTEYAAELAQARRRACERALRVIESEPGLAGYSAAFVDDCDIFGRLEKALLGGDWDKSVMLAQGCSFTALKAAKKAPEDLKESLKAQRQQNKDTIKRICEKVLTCTAAEFSEDVNDLLPKIRALFKLAGETDDLLLARKHEAGVFDFSDLSQLTVKLLVKKSENGLELTETAKELQSRFDEVMVDEYQDVNAVQDMIVSALSNGENLFMVGDVKQSIYRFRQARPEIFLDRSERYKTCAPDAGGQLITLGGNFRSRVEVTTAINNIFEPLFSKKIGDLVYDEGHKLNALASYPAAEGAGVSFKLFEQGSLDAGESTSAQAREVAREIKQMLQSGVEVCENGVMRPICQGDIAILLRSPKKLAEIYRSALENEGISAFAALESGFLTTNEISPVINLLKSIENPTRDIELSGAMLSPMFGFSAEQLAQMRANEPQGHFCLAVEDFAQKDEKTAAFWQLFCELRRMAATDDAMRVISAAIERTGFDLSCRAMKNGRQRFGNLMLLIQYAQQYHDNGYRGVSGFLKMIDRITNQKSDLAPAFVGEQTNSVTITSIHKSKGLEWPVVFLCEAGREHSFYRNDIISPTILHSELGFACVRRDEKARCQFSTAPLDAVRIESARAMFSEELRVLYVAATRAKERLIITAAMKKAVAAARSCGDESDADPIRVRECKSYAQWLLTALGCYGDVSAALQSKKTLGGIKLELGYLEPQEESKQNGENAQISLEELSPQREAAPDLEAVDRLKERIAFVYPHSQQAKLPAKLSVSQITHEKSDEYRFAQKPAFAVDKKASGSERGSAVHAFMQYCDYGAARENADAERERMVSRGILTPRQGSLVDTAAVAGFFGSALADRMFASKDILREFAFMASAAQCPSAAEYSSQGEATMLQGIADCIFIEEDRAVLVDYKTDFVKTPEELIERYSAQLILYREMLSGILPLPVTEGIIWSFALNREIKVF